MTKGHERTKVSQPPGWEPDSSWRFDLQGSPPQMAGCILAPHCLSSPALSMNFVIRLLLVFLAITLHTRAADAPKLRAGAATSNITPPLGLPIVGGFRPFPATHIHDELHARCLVLESGETRLAFIVCDLLGASEAMFDEARRFVTAETNIPAANLFMSCTHTHSATSVLG